MKNLKKASTHKTVLENNHQFEHATVKKKSSIHKCPVHTLLTRIFSGIAWNG